jgi:hypothetical protein
MRYECDFRIASLKEGGQKRRPGSLGGAARAEGRNWFVKLKL